MITNEIYSYEDYRKFLTDYFSAMKEKKSHFSFRYFASKAGFKSPNFCYYLMNGTRNVSEDSIDKLIKGLGLKGKASTYFKAMVNYTQSNSQEEKNRNLKHMQKIRHSLQYKNLDPKSYKYLEEWYYPVVRELIIQKDLASVEEIASKVVPKITEKQAKKAIEVLLECGLIKEIDKKYIQSDNIISTKEIPHHVVKNIKKQHIYNSINAMDTLPKEERYLSGSTLCLSKDGYEKSLEILEKAHEEIIRISSEDAGNNVFQINFQLYPNTINKD